MKISYNWLKEYLDIDMSDEKLSEVLTEIGLEVSKVEKFESVKGGLEGLVIGKVLTCEKHPNADKLSKTTVDVGGEILPIVCGAPNVAAGQKVVVAKVGTILYDGGEEWKIKKSKIRGEVSEGMICAEDELGLGDDHEGIMVLDEKVPEGTAANEYFDIYRDTIFEIDLTPNRPDAISHFGVARDLYAYLSLNTDMNLELKLPDVSSFSIDNNKKNIEIEVKNTEACPRYSGLTVSDIEIKDSPKWMQNRLRAIGLKPINNIVDITNYVLHEIGHPLHAFDIAEIKGEKIIVTTVKEGTKFTTLEEREIELTEKDLMICDSEGKPMCIGGVMGGIKSGVKSKTKGIFIESAFFNPVWVRKTAKRHTISTDASYRFERGVDPNNCLWTLKRAALLIKEFAGGEISSEIKDIYSEKLEDFLVDLSYKQLDKLIGFEIDRDIIKNILTLLEIKIIEQSEQGLKLQVPTYRFEVRRQADIIEEIIRIYGYNKIPLPEKMYTTVLVQEKNISEEMRENVSHALTGRGFYEIMSFSLLNGEIYSEIDEKEKKKSVEMQNPLSKELSTMRKSLVFGALDAVRKNISYQNPDIKFFEFGSIYYNTEKENFEGRYIQKYRLSLTMKGQKNKLNWKTAEEKVDFYTIKSNLEAVLLALCFDRRNFKVKEFSDDIYKYGIEYFIDNKSVAKTGALSKKILKKYTIDEDVFFAEIEWNDLIKKMPKRKQFSELIKYQKVRRDLALLIDKDVKYRDIEKIALETDKRLIKDVNIFDVYEGENIPEGKKSYAVSFILQDETKTLTDKVMNKVMNKLINNYKQKLGAEIR